MNGDGNGNGNGVLKNISPGSKRKLMEREKIHENYVCGYIEREVNERFEAMNLEKEKRRRRRKRKHNNDDNGDDDNGCDDCNEVKGEEVVDNDDDDDDDDNADATDNEVEVHVDPSRVSVYIDPLDGTSAYAKKQFEFVTILAGVMLDNIPIFGIIVKPFGHDGYNIDFHNNKNGMDMTKLPNHDSISSTLGFNHSCCAMYGGTLLGGAFVVSGDELHRSHIHRNQEDSPSSSRPSSILLKERKAIISKSRRGGVVQQCITSLSSKGLLHPEPIFITGAGYKTMRLLLGTFNETMWFFPKPGTSLWDVAAADALLRVMGGRISDKFGHDLDYSKNWTEANNLDGIVACSDKKLHETCIQLYHNERWDDHDP